MRHICLVFAAMVLSGTGVSAQPVDCPGHLHEWARQLDQYYAYAHGHPDSLHFQQRFFEAFPGTYSELDCLYGYHDGIPAPLYEQAFDHINGLLNRLESINDTTYFRKLIGTSIGGKWDADGVSYFQDAVHERSLKEPRLLFELLSSRAQAEMRSFLYFFFHGVHPPFHSIPDAFIDLEGDHPEVFAQMKHAFREAMADSGH